MKRAASLPAAYPRPHSPSLASVLSLCVLLAVAACIWLSGDVNLYVNVRGGGGEQALREQDISSSSSHKASSLHPLSTNYSSFLDNNRVSPSPSLGFPVIALVFAGRRHNLRILDVYLRRNLVDVGGLISRVDIVVTSTDKEDRDHIARMADSHPRYAMITPEPRTYNDAYNGLYKTLSNGAMYIKIDDDVLFIRDCAIEAMVQEMLTDKWLFVSANVVNHPQLSFIHAHTAALPYIVNFDEPFPTDSPDPDWRVTDLPPIKGSPETARATPAEPSLWSWEKPSFMRYPPREFKFGLRRVSNSVNLEFTPAKEASLEHDGACFKSWECAALMHYSLFERLETETLDEYDFGVWNLHGRSWNPWSTNFFAMWGDTLNTYPPFGQDELFVSSVLPRRLQRPCAAVGSAIVSHYSYDKQLKGLDYTDVIERYEALAKQVAKRPRPEVVVNGVVDGGERAYLFMSTD